MNVLRGVSCWLAAFCVVALTVSLPGCNKKSTSNSTDTKADKSNEKPSNQKPEGDNGKSGKQVVAGNSEKNTSSRVSDGGDNSPVKARFPNKATIDDKDPIPAAGKESGSGTKRKLRGPKLGSGR
jgi:hypothetical protein